MIAKIVSNLRFVFVAAVGKKLGFFWVDVGSDL